MKSLLSALQNGKVLVSDGAWGTFLYQQGLQAGECPELWNITHRSIVYGIGKSYIKAGADMILTNSFGGSPLKLAHYGLQDRAVEINKTAAEISREAAEDDHFVLGSIGPTGVMLILGQVSEETMFDGFGIQARALKSGGVDAICVETMTAVDEACLAVRAAKETTGLEVICTFTFDRMNNGEYRTMMGASPEEAIQAVKEAGASIIGTNCGNGFDQMIDIVREIRKFDQTTPVLVHANAGLPVNKNGKVEYLETPEMMASKVPELIKSGANIIGGCCGTTPAHIRALAKEIRAK
ncbi:MAG: homocysteine S-methyltransferase family protein [Calditrichaceae bacterium]|nr:homocysteine S-methyltransferase family protein [Calditrichaceae bacterium]MBN2708394.1 homocysteine S-methyltransferase family protein [Calditrichaceae bacterium]